VRSAPLKQRLALGVHVVIGSDQLALPVALAEQIAAGQIDRGEHVV
jgi:hypothetical protein